MKTASFEHFIRQSARRMSDYNLILSELSHQIDMHLSIFRTQNTKGFDSEEERDEHEVIIEGLKKARSDFTTRKNSMVIQFAKEYLKHEYPSIESENRGVN